MYHHGLAAFDLQHVFDALLRRQADCGDGAGLLQVEDVWYFADVVGFDHGVFRVEPALRIAEAVGVDEVAWREPADAGADGGDGAGAVGAEDEWKRRTLLLRPHHPPRISASQLPMLAVCTAMDTSVGPGSGTASSWHL